MNTHRPARRTLALALLASVLAVPALAQAIYQSVGPDGSITLTDVPQSGRAPARPGAGTPAGAAAAGTQLPFELRQTSSRYPVTLYTGRDCAPCNSGRNLLNARGIPYSEKTVETRQDAEALKRLSGETSLPFLTIGSQQIKGYSDTEWTQFLDAAGYPKQSALPSSYRRPAAAPLVAVRPAEAAPPSSTARAQPTAPSAPAEVPVTAPPQNPAGIRF